MKFVIFVVQVSIAPNMFSKKLAIVSVDFNISRKLRKTMGRELESL